MYDVILQPITPESKIPFKKVLLLSNGTTVVVGILKAITKDGYSFDRIASTVGIDGIIQDALRTPFSPTHYAILNIQIEK